MPEIHMYLRRTATTAAVSTLAAELTGTAQQTFVRHKQTRRLAWRWRQVDVSTKGRSWRRCHKLSETEAICTRLVVGRADGKAESPCAHGLGVAGGAS